MRAEWVVDASVAVKCLITERHSQEARAFAVSGARWLAPDLVFAEVANVALKRTRRGDIDRAFAEAVVEGVADLFEETAALSPLTSAAHRIAQDARISQYDALYLALAVERDIVMVTCDERLVRALAGGPLAHRTALLTEVPEIGRARHIRRKPA